MSELTRVDGDAPGPRRPLVLDAKAAAAFCGVSRSTWWGHHAAGRIPLPMRLGRKTLWRVSELIAWTEAGMPARERWEVLKASPKAI